MSDTIETIERDGLTAKIVYDTDPISPRDWDNAWTLHIDHRDYRIIEGSKYDDPDELTADGAIVVPIRAYIHSDIALSVDTPTGQFADRFDSGWIGFAYVTRKTLLKVYGHKIVTANDKADALACLKGEIEALNQYFSGSVYGVVIENAEGDRLDSSWGIYDDYALAHVKETADEMLTAALEDRAEALSAVYLALDEFDSVSLV